MPLLISAAGVGPGGAAIATPFSFFASARAIARVGARPVFVDVDPRRPNLDPSRVDSKLRSGRWSKFKAILPVQLYGQRADMTALERISQEFRVPIIEDAAQALGATGCHLASSICRSGLDLIRSIRKSGAHTATGISA